MIGSDFLTSAGIDRQTRRSTQPGQAFWAGTGPAGAVCRDCRWWQGSREPSNTGAPRKGACAEFRRLSGNGGPPFPGGTAACKYFEPLPPSPAKRAA